MKKHTISILLLTAAVLTTNVSNAAEDAVYEVSYDKKKDTSSETDSFKSYMGVSVGVRDNVSNFKRNTAKYSGGAYGISLQAFAGAGKVYDNKCYLGIEARGGVDSSMITFFKDDPYKFSLKQNWNIGIGPRLGYVIGESNSLVYASFLIENTNYKLKLEEAGESNAKTFNVVRLVPGIGFETDIYTSVKLRVELDYGIEFGNKVLEVGPDKVEINTHSKNIQVGVSYQF
jgi:hypothetical protein